LKFGSDSQPNRTRSHSIDLVLSEAEHVVATPAFQIVGNLREHEAGVKTADVCRKNDIGSATFFKWKSEYTWFGPQSPEPTVRNFKIQAD
jgi:hypothetical protein